MDTEPTDVRGPLSGVRVVELAGIGPGPFAAMMLADLGAEVVRVDRPEGTDTPTPPPYDILGRGRPNVAVDLKNPRGAAVVLDLVGRADILVEGFRPGVAERLGIGPEECLARRPSLVYARMTGWGQSGPLAQSAGHDIDYLAVAGGLDPLGRRDEAPAIPLNIMGDFAGGSLYLVAGVLAALTWARAGGGGQVVDVAITDGVAHLLSMAISMHQAGMWDGHRGTNLLGGAAPFYDVYQTADRRWMAVGALESRFFKQLVGVTGIAFEGPRTPERWPELRRLLEVAFASRSQAEWVEAFTGVDACVAPVVSLEDAPTHPHNAARGTYVDVGGVVQPRPAPRFSATPTSIGRPPARTGEDTTEVLRAWGVADVDQLLRDQVVFQAGEESRA